MGRSEDDEGGCDLEESVKETCMGALYNECWKCPHVNNNNKENE